MNQQPLATYLHDHLAGAVAGTHLLEHLRDEHLGEALGQFAAELLAEIEEDRAILQQIAEHVGAGSSPLKEATAWVGEKLSRLKLGGAKASLGTFETLETLGLGILGKLALWRALAVVAADDPRLRGFDLQRLAERARQQHARVEEHRLQVAVLALRESD